jgi:gamma-glutamyltranspeptidase/glutathione hydrolase
VLTIVVGVVEYGLNGRQAVDLARIHHQWLPDYVAIEKAGANDSVVAALQAMGHEVRLRGRQGDAHSIWVSPEGMPYGVNDKRSTDSKASKPVNLTPGAYGR